MHSAMQHAIVQSILIIQFFQYIQGTIRPLNTKLHSENAGLYKFDSYFVEKLDAFPRTDKYNAVDGFPRLLRARRQNAGNNPEAYSFTLTGDDRRFAGVLYSGEGSQVNALSYSYSCSYICLSPVVVQSCPIQTDIQGRNAFTNSYYVSDGESDGVGPAPLLQRSVCL